MGYVPYVGFATYRRAIVKIRLYFKKLTYMQMFCIKIKKKKKKKCSSHYLPRSDVSKLCPAAFDRPSNESEHSEIELPIYDPNMTH